jgi:hypothetical protein
MRVVDPGHEYLLDVLDETLADDAESLRFVKREGDGYPGNVGHHPGTNMQEVLRALIDRLRYVNGQIHDNRNLLALENLQAAIFHLECRAAARHHRPIAFEQEGIELLPTCSACGHIGHVCEERHAA